MDELIKQLAQKTGLPEAQAKQAAEFVVNFIKSKLPAPIAAQVDGALRGGGVSAAASKLGGVFNR